MTDCWFVWFFLKKTHTYIYPRAPHKQKATQDQFFNGVSLVRIQSCPSPKPVAIPSLNSPTYPTIYHGRTENSWMHSFPNYVKCKQPRLGFELESPSLFSTTITITPRMSIYTCVCMRVCVCVWNCSGDVTSRNLISCVTLSFRQSHF